MSLKQHQANGDSPSDDLTVTSKYQAREHGIHHLLTQLDPEFIKKAIELKSCNALLLKVNQIGTLTESIQAAKDAFAAGWGM